MIDQGKKNVKIRKSKKVSFKPNPELGVLFDKFEENLFEDHKRTSSDRLKAASEIEGYTHENQLLE